MPTNLQIKQEVYRRLHVTEEMRGDWDYRHLLKDIMPETEYNEPEVHVEQEVEGETIYSNS